MDAIQFIERDHREVEQLFKSFERAERAGDRAKARDVVRDVVRALSVHAVIEEQFVYPALRRAGARARVLDALEEHHAVKQTLAGLEALPASHPRLGAKVRLVAEQVRQHVEEEERELLPLLERTLDAGERRALGETLARAQAVAPTRPHPAAPDEPPGNFVVGAFAAVWDRGRDALRGGAAVLAALASQGLRSGLRAVTGLATRARAQGPETLRGVVEQGRGAVGEALERGREAAERGRSLVADATERGRSAAGALAERAEEAVEQGREVAGVMREGVRESAARVEVRAGQAAKEVRGTSRATAAKATRAARGNGRRRQRAPGRRRGGRRGGAR